MNQSELLMAYTNQLELLMADQQELPNKLVQLIRMKTGLVRKIAFRVSHQCADSYESYGDLEKIGYLGLIRAIERFNPNQGCAFSSFAVPYIRGEMLRYLHKKGAKQDTDRQVSEELNISTLDLQQIRRNLVKKQSDFLTNSTNTDSEQSESPSNSAKNQTSFRSHCTSLYLRIHSGT